MTGTYKLPLWLADRVRMGEQFSGRTTVNFFANWSYSRMPSCGCQELATHGTGDTRNWRHTASLAISSKRSNWSVRFNHGPLSLRKTLRGRFLWSRDFVIVRHGKQIRRLLVFFNIVQFCVNVRGLPLDYKFEDLVDPDRSRRSVRCAFVLVLHCFTTVYYCRTDFFANNLLLCKRLPALTRIIRVLDPEIL
jgi:hypothetical protein